MSKKELILFSGGGWHFRGIRGYLMDEWILSLTGKENPEVCLLATPQGDSPRELASCFKALQPRAKLTWAPMFNPLPEGQDPTDNLLNADVIYIPGGYAQATVACWRASGWDMVLREAWENGVIIAGMCAGAMSFCHQYANRWMDKPGVGEGLGFLNISFTAHAQHQLYEPVGSIFRHGIRDGLLVPGYQLQDGFALRFNDNVLLECLKSEPDNAKGWHIEPAENEEQKISALELEADSLEERVFNALPELKDKPFIELYKTLNSLDYKTRYKILNKDINNNEPFENEPKITSSIESPKTTEKNSDNLDNQEEAFGNPENIGISA